MALIKLRKPFHICTTLEFCESNCEGYVSRVEKSRIRLTLAGPMSVPSMQTMSLRLPPVVPSLMLHEQVIVVKFEIDTME